MLPEQSCLSACPQAAGLGQEVKPQNSDTSKSALSLKQGMGGAMLSGQHLRGKRVE